MMENPFGGGFGAAAPHARFAPRVPPKETGEVRGIMRWKDGDFL